MGRAASAQPPEQPPEPDLTGAVPAVADARPRSSGSSAPGPSSCPAAEEELTAALESDAAASFAYGLVADAASGILNPLPRLPGRTPGTTRSWSGRTRCER